MSHSFNLLYLSHVRVILGKTWEKIPTNLLIVSSHCTVSSRVDVRLYITLKGQVRTQVSAKSGDYMYIKQQLKIENGEY